MSDREVLTTAELADLLGVHWRTLHRVRERGEGPPAYKIGRVYRYRRSDVEAWIREQASTTIEAALVDGFAKTPVTAGGNAEV